ncbi:MAG: nicotinate-nucleotide adenylyltransferase [Gammaproteobacteria bacterium SG8_47]|nr:MAG: nicotinate-nucleotide adenylyltransferase [Gammaproteobacteria bacterium SG8_47]
MERHIRDPHQKALAINLDKSVYGTIAEIGAGQETARWFFRVGGAAGTIAKSISAYDMKFSDAIYGPSPRYVSRDRLGAMLHHEFALVLDRLDEHRGTDSTFFAFANTVAARSYSRKMDGHGWLGIRFQHEPRAPASQIDLHVNLHGTSNVRDQETLGVLGVNLIYGAMHLHTDCETLLASLMDQLYPELVEIDMVDFSGPAFAAVDNRVMALRLVQKGFSSAAMFTADGHIAEVADALWKKAVLVERSRFRPPTKLTMELLDRAQATFLQETNLAPEELVVLSEMTLNNLTDGGDIDVGDFLNRADILCALGKSVLVSNYGEHYRLAQYLFRYTERPIAVVMGLPTLREIFDEKYYENLPGGILESFGRLFKHDLRLYVCPECDSASGTTRDLQDLELASDLRHLYAYLLERGCIKPLDGVKAAHLSIYSHEVLARIRDGGSQWEGMVPPEVARIIKERRLFGLPGG